MGPQGLDGFGSNTAKVRMIRLFASVVGAWFFSSDRDIIQP